MAEGNPTALIMYNKLDLIHSIPHYFYADSEPAHSKNSFTNNFFLLSFEMSNKKIDSLPLHSSRVNSDLDPDRHTRCGSGKIMLTQPDMQHCWH